MLGKNGEGHWALAAVQLLVGACFVIPQWVLGVRAKPGLTLAQWKALAPIGKKRMGGRERGRGGGNRPYLFEVPPSINL